MGTAEHLLFIPYLQLMRVLSNAHPFIFVYLHLDCISFSLVCWPCLPIDPISQCVCYIQCQLMCLFPACQIPIPFVFILFTLLQCDFKGPSRLLHAHVTL